MNYNLKTIEDLLEFRRSLEFYILDSVKFTDFKTKEFFKQYIKSIRFLPKFRRFGFSQYSLYFRQFDYDECDFKLILLNTFQKIKYRVCIKPNQAFFCNYIFPFRSPNKKYLNWRVKAKKNITEYCLFYKKRLYDIIHFTRSLIKDNWNYSSIKFKSYTQDVLFNPNYKPKFSGIREVNLDKPPANEIFGPSSKEYNALTSIYNTQSIDIKSYIGTTNYTIIKNINKLLKRELIFPYISLKNLDFQDKISIILPDVKQEFNENIIKIFSFFNYCRIYEIEGEFLIRGFLQERYFENGFLIEIWFPKCELIEFFKVFNSIFQYFEIKDYLILNNLVNGKTLLKSVYGNLNFLKDYNPLLNLKWNDKDKIWINHNKICNQNFEPIYPDLIFKD